METFIILSSPSTTPKMAAADSPDSINYAEYVGIKSVALAAIFAGLYAPLLAYFIFRVFKNLTLTLFMMCLFCQGTSDQHADPKLC